jgi:hypothetical protein
MYRFSSLSFSIENAVPIVTMVFLHIKSALDCRKECANSSGITVQKGKNHTKIKETIQKNSCPNKTAYRTTMPFLLSIDYYTQNYRVAPRRTFL